MSVIKTSLFWKLFGFNAEHCRQCGDDLWECRDQPHR